MNIYQILFWILFWFLILSWFFPKSMRAIKDLIISHIRRGNNTNYKISQEEVDVLVNEIQHRLIPNKERFK